jgi:hypothetical protein
MNVLVLGGRIVGVELARELIGAFLNARFSGEARHQRRLAKITALENPLRALQVFGQSVWLDYIRRSLITSGELHRLIEEDGLRGVTSNPAIFEKAITGSSDYRAMFERPEIRKLDAKTVYERLAIQDIQVAADVLRPIYEETSRRDGYVSLEVSPLLAYDTAATHAHWRRERVASRPTFLSSDQKPAMVSVCTSRLAVGLPKIGPQDGCSRANHNATTVSAIKFRAPRPTSGALPSPLPLLHNALLRV